MKVDIIGAGLSGLYAACNLSKKGYEVSVYEKNESVGGRSRVFNSNGFSFDMGPSWYWMPELIDQLFEDLGENREDYFKLKRLDPAYKVFWKDSKPSEIPADFNQLKLLFDEYEENGGAKLVSFIKKAQLKYEIALREFIQKPGVKINEVINLKVLGHFFKLDLLKSVQKEVNATFKSDKARAILTFPSLFLGEMPNRIPSLYTLMNFADLKLGTWYPEGGMGALAKALKTIAEKNGVKFHFSQEVKKIHCSNKQAIALQFESHIISTEKLIVSGDYHHSEQVMLDPEYRKYSSKYWKKRRMAPSCLIFYIGLDKKVPELTHHNLFFDEDLNEHGKTIYRTKKWPKNPLFYVCTPSKTDETVAPLEGENLFILIPISSEVEETEELKEKYFQKVLNRIERHTGCDISSSISYKRSYCIEDFKNDYNAFKGNAYGLANTLKQTANLKPKITSKLDNLFYCGQLTVPGPGVPPALISGKITSNFLINKI